jgi:hypothetical protein
MGFQSDIKKNIRQQVHSISLQISDIQHPLSLN